MSKCSNKAIPITSQQRAQADFTTQGLYHFESGRFTPPSGIVMERPCPSPLIVITVSFSALFDVNTKFFELHVHVGHVCFPHHGFRFLSLRCSICWVPNSRRCPTQLHMSDIRHNQIDRHTTN